MTRTKVCRTSHGVRELKFAYLDNIQDDVTIVLVMHRAKFMIRIRHSLSRLNTIILRKFTLNMNPFSVVKHANFDFRIQCNPITDQIAFCPPEYRLSLQTHSLPRTDELPVCHHQLRKIVYLCLFQKIIRFFISYFLLLNMFINYI